MNINTKQISFNNAMEKYHTKKRYGYIYLLVSTLNVSMQVYLLFVLLNLSIELHLFFMLFFMAYFMTDFINGFVHMYMDNNQNYDSIMGPFITSFHLHHKNPSYRSFSILRIYFNESGSKFWLVPFLMLTISMTFMGVNIYLLGLFIFIGILSSVAEVSHFLCHNSEHKFVLFLQNIRLLLPMRHHRNHHEKDNQSYAFLNGTSDFLLDKIAKKVYRGYKEHSDIHAQKYEGLDTSNRA